MTALQHIIKEAKSIRKKYPNKEWKDCVKQASAIYASKHKGKSPVGKKKAVKKNVKKKAVKKTVKKKAVKKKVGAVKKIAKKSLSSHKDNKSHNVNIRVMSGVKVYGIEQYKKCIADTNKWEKILQHLEKEKLKAPKEYRSSVLRDIKLVKQQIKECKTHSKELKKHI
jgi:hypothetical protein